MHERFASLNYDEAKAVSYKSKFKIYLAGPLNAPDAVGYIKNLHKMAKKGSELIKAGYSVFIPGIDFLAGVVDGDWSYEDYFDNSQPWLLSSHAVYLMPGWQNSKGTVKELALANDNGIPVVDTDEDLEYYARQWFEFYEFDKLMQDLSPIIPEEVENQYCSNCEQCDKGCVCDRNPEEEKEEITEADYLNNLIEESKIADETKKKDLFLRDKEIEIKRSIDKYGVEKIAKILFDYGIEVTNDDYALPNSYELKREGIKYDDGKLRFDLIPIDALIGIAEIFTHGSKKYGDNDWQKVKPAIRYYAAAMRHITAHLTGEQMDQDSGLRHLDHAIVSLIMLRELTK